LAVSAEVEQYRVAPGSFSPKQALKACLKFQDTAPLALIEHTQFEFGILSKVAQHKAEESGKDTYFSFDLMKDCMTY
jgi:hypothetical protein